MPRVVLMGEPGSGKTTLAKEVARLTRVEIVEASEAVIYPIASISGRWSSEERMLAFLGGLGGKASARVSRERAMETFRRAQEAYSEDFIARALHVRYQERSARKTFVFSGLRGVRNAEYCRLHNDFVVYLDASTTTLAERLVADRGYAKRQALEEIRAERRLYRTLEIKKVANLVVDTSDKDVAATARQIVNAIQREYQMCTRCVNVARNPSVLFDENGLCNVCRSYAKSFDKRHLAKEISFLKSLKGKGTDRYDVMVGISGGKDSTATLATVVEMGFRPLAFTFDTGYLPETTVPRARSVARQMGVDYEVIDIRPYVRTIDRAAYQKTAALYEEPFNLATKKKFLSAYAEGRKHYSVKCGHSPAFVRSCQLCRRLVVRAYYGEASKRAIPAVILGINEWTNLSAAQRGGTFRVSGMRTLQPNVGQAPVHIFHLPFLLGRTSAQTKRILKRLGWEAPRGEDFIESNSNSCLFARSTERMARRLLGFHPDSMRLAREVTVGFISKDQALKALGKIHPYALTPRRVLEKAGILK